MQTTSILDFLIIGLFSGLNAACWGLYKDSLFEEIHKHKFLRSIVFAVFITFCLYYCLKYLGIVNYNLGILFCTVVAIERLSTEIYKGFFRQEPQHKYKIPAYFHWGTYIVKNMFVKNTVGTAVFFLVIGLFYLVHLLTAKILHLEVNIFMGMVIGLCMGILEAIGGVQKDAPFEGFDPLKVYRSPIIHMISGGFLSFFTNSYALLFLASGGLGRMTIEFYKTFMVHKTPGKFKAESPVYPIWKRKRQVVVIPYLLTWLVFFFYLLK